MLNPYTTSQYKKDCKLLAKQNKDMDKLNAILRKLANEEPLDPRYRDHKLVKNYSAFRGC